MTTPVLEIYKIFEKKEGVSQRGTQWARQQFACKTDEQYTKYPLFTVMNENALSQLAALQVGDKVTVDFELDSHKWNDTIYPDIVAWRIINADGTQQQTAGNTIMAKDVPPTQESVAAAQAQPTPEQAAPANDGSDDLPF